jgi:hypothetical protein
MFRKSSSEKSLQGIQKSMNLHFYSHLNKNPQLVEASEEKLMKSVWDDPYVQHNYVMPMASRMGVDYARNQFVDTLGKVRSDVKCRRGNY